MESQEVKEELVFVLETWAVKMFEEKLDAMICALSLNGLKTEEVR